jgi:tRNA-dihydrouridine synthase
MSSALKIKSRRGGQRDRADDGVSDLPFRRAASRPARPVATEMVACAEFAKGRPDVVRRAAVGESLPLMVQLVGRDPAHGQVRAGPQAGAR